jgi:hypothetical protein
VFAGSALIGAVVIGTVLVLTGNPSACVDRQVPVSAAESQRLKAEWDQFSAASRQGNATILITESEATSRGVEYVDEKDAPVEDLQVYFCPGGYAEASGKVKAVGISAKVIVRGTLDLSGDQPQIQVDEIRAGNLPSAVAKPAVNFVLDRADFKTLDLDEHLTSISYADGTATVAGGP